MNKFITSITIPSDWHYTFVKLSALRKQQHKKPNSVNGIMLEAMESGYTDLRLEVIEREGRRQQ